MVPAFASFELPVPPPAILISAIGHSGLHADPAHRWLHLGAIRKLLDEKYSSIREIKTFLFINQRL